MQTPNITPYPAPSEPAAPTATTSTSSPSAPASPTFAARDPIPGMLHRRAMEMLRDPRANPAHVRIFVTLLQKYADQDLKDRQLAFAREKFEFDAAKAAIKHVDKLKDIRASRQKDITAQINEVRRVLFGEVPPGYEVDENGHPLGPKKGYRAPFFIYPDNWEKEEEEEEAQARAKAQYDPDPDSVPAAEPVPGSSPSAPAADASQAKEFDPSPAIPPAGTQPIADLAEPFPSDAVPDLARAPEPAPVLTPRQRHRQRLAAISAAKRRNIDEEISRKRQTNTA